MQNLRDINFEHTKITDAGVRALRSLKMLSRLNLERTPITDSAIDTLANLPMLDQLNIDYNSQLTDKCISSVLKMKKLRTLTLKYTSVSFDGLQRLKPLNLDYLEIGSRYSPEQLQKLKSLAKEVRISVSNVPSQEPIYDELLQPRH